MFAVYRLRTYAVFDFIILLRAKPRPSKKARLDKTAEEDVVLEAGKTPNAEGLFLRIFPMIHRSQMMILLLKRDLLMPQVLSISPQVPSGLKAPPVQQNLLTSQQLQCKPAVPRMMRLSLLALAILSQAILSLYPNILPRKNLLLLAKASGTLI